MRNFANLIRKLDSTTKTTLKVNALADYFENATNEDKVWTIAILSHRRPPRPVNTSLLRKWASGLADIPLWLFEESYHIVGDLAETIALVIPASTESSSKTLTEFLSEMKTLKRKEEKFKEKYVTDNLRKLNYYERFVFTKLITGGFRIGVSQKLMTRALSKATGIDEDILAYKLMGKWDPNEISFEDLVLQENASDFLSKPYPFYLAYGLEGDVSELGSVEDWSIEHKWDGIRSQVIIREGELFVWSRGEELVTDKYPEFHPFANVIPNGTVLDGEILPFPKNAIGTFNDLQTRIGRKSVSKALLAKTPVILKVYDLLEWGGEDFRQQRFRERRRVLEGLMSQLSATDLPIFLSEAVQCTSWSEVAEERDRAREMKSEGLMIKRRDSNYQVGRKKGDWWKWKTDPFSIDAVLTYAMRGHGRRSNLFTDYTFALWNEERDDLVTFAKAYSGLTDAEFRKVDAWIKKHTLERFGPVRSVTPELVFEIAFEGISRSKRHKSGYATRFPRIVRWRQDKTIDEANTLQDLETLCQSDR